MRTRTRRDAGWTVDDAPYRVLDFVPDKSKDFKKLPPPAPCDVLFALPSVTVKAPDAVKPSACMNHPSADVNLPLMFGPNITGAATQRGGSWYQAGDYTGCMYSNRSDTEDSGGAGHNGVTFYIDASRSSSVFDNSSTVQPASLRVLILIKA